MSSGPKRRKGLKKAGTPESRSRYLQRPYTGPIVSGEDLRNRWWLAARAKITPTPEELTGMLSLRSQRPPSNISWGRLWKGWLWLGGEGSG